MRTLDIASASAVGIICVILIAFTNPSGYIEDSSRIQHEISLRNYLLNIVYGRGLHFFQSASSEQLCLLSLLSSNISLKINFSLYGDGCVHVELPADCIYISLQLVSRRVYASACREEQ